MEQTRKQELQEELNNIRAKEIEDQLIKDEELGSSVGAIQKAKDAEAIRNERKIEAKTHRAVTIGDFILKFTIASAISGAFMYIVYAGSQMPITKASALIGAAPTKDNGLFQLLSVVGPLFGMVLSYYFGKSKSSVNGE